MPHKHNADRRHHIPKMSFKVRNWPAYEAGLRRRGSLTLWIEDAALGDWQSTGPGGQARYTDAAIQTSLMLRMAFKLALRETEGLMMSVLTLMGLTLSNLFEWPVCASIPFLLSGDHEYPPGWADGSRDVDRSASGTPRGWPERDGIDLCGRGDGAVAGASGPAA